jgi:hypothetical protein
MNGTPASQLSPDRSKAKSRTGRYSGTARFAPNHFHSHFLNNFTSLLKNKLNFEA